RCAGGRNGQGQEHECERAVRGPRHRRRCRAGHAGGMMRRLMSCLALCAVASSASALSLYDESTFQSLTSDRRALRPGDSLTVLVMENSSASTTANTTTKKTGGITGGLKGNATHGASVS